MNIQWQAPIKALERWTPCVLASFEEKNVINMYDMIGEGYYTTGVTASMVSEKLDVYGGDDVTVNINSAGGDMFEGLAIYNILKEYEGSVKVKVLGMAASAASIIAMAGDEIEIGESAFFMIHNAWSLAIGNKYDFEKAAKDFDKFDNAMANVYVSKTGIEYAEIVKMMDDETWIGGQDAVEKGFATKLLDTDEIKKLEEGASARSLRKVDTALAKAGISRSERRDLLKELTNTPSAVDTTPSASDEQLKDELKCLLAKLNTQTKE